MGLNKFIPICRAGNFHKFFRDMKQLMDLWPVPNQEPIKDTRPNQWHCLFQEVPWLLETYTFQCQKYSILVPQCKKIWKTFSCFWYPCYNVRAMWPSEIAFVYTTNPTEVKNEFAQYRRFGMSLTHPAHSDSSLISALFVKTDNLLLVKDGIKLLISNIVPICIFVVFM